MITEDDIFRAFVEILGRGEADLRITLRVGDEPGELANLSRVIADLGGNICLVGLVPERGFRARLLHDPA